MSDSPQKRVLILADGMPAGGTERQIVELLKGFQDNVKFQTYFGVLVKGGEREDEAFHYAKYVLPIRQSSQYDFSLAFSLIRLTKKFQIDLIHTFGSVSDFSGVVAGKINGIPVVNGSIRSARPRLNKRDQFSKFCMRFATWVVANSNAGLKAFGMDTKQNSCVIYNGVDMTRFVDIEAISATRPTLCMVGNFTRKKDHCGLIEIMPELKELYPNLQLVLVGRGEKLKQLKERVEALELKDCVVFVTNCNSPESIIKACDIGVLLSPEGEGLSNVIVEYMALGKPVIASSMGGNVELVSHGKTGFLVSDSSSRQLVNYIKQLINSPKLASKIGLAGREAITNNFTISRMVAEYEQLYCRLTEEAEC